VGEIGSSHWTIYPKFPSNFGSSIKGELSSQSTAAAPVMTSAFHKEAASGGGKVGRKFGDQFKGALSPILATLSVAAIGSFVSSSVDSFAQLQDASAAAAVVFGDSMGKITEQAETAASTMGLSKQAVIDAANTFGTYGKSAGLAGDDLASFSTQMTQLAGDMASFKGTSTEQAVMAVGAAMRGEMEPIRTYGVMLDDLTLRQQAMKLGLISTTKEALTPQQKVLAAQAAILAQTSDAQGDFARTADSTANTSKTLAAEQANLAAQIGEKLAPAITAAQRAGIGLIEFVTRFQSVLLPLAGVVGVAGAALAGFVLISKGLEAVNSAKAMLSGLAESFNALSTAARAATIATGVIGVVLTAASVAYSAFASNQEATKQSTQDLTEAIKADNGELGENTRLKVANRLETDGLFVVAQRYGVALSDVTDAALGNADALARVQAVLQSHRDAQFDSAIESVEFREDANKLTAAIGGQSVEVQNAAAAYGRLAEANARATTAAQLNASATKLSADEQKKLVDELQKTIQAQLTLSGSQMGLEAAIDGAAESVKKYRAELVKKYQADGLSEEAAKRRANADIEAGKALDINTEAGRTNRQALDQIAAAGLSVVDSLQDTNASSEDVTAAMGRTRTSFIRAAEKMGLSTEEAKKLARQLGLIKSKDVDIRVRVKATGNFDQSSGLRVYVSGSGQKLLADGGRVPGVAFHDRDDKIPAMLTPDEWVIRRNASRYYGDAVMSAINSARIPRERLQGFADGGRAGARSASSPAGVAAVDLRAALVGMEVRFTRSDIIADYVMGRFELAKEMA
jgi:hypothetical protein